MTAAKHSPMFRTGLESIVRGEILVPPLRSYLANPEFRGFDLKVRGIGSRDPDGWFHPSEHPRWPLRALWLWLCVPSLVEREPLGPETILAMTAGSIWHAIIERALLDMDMLIGNEVRFEHPATMTRGSADGHLRMGDLMEFKSMKDMNLRKIDSVETFIARHPDYHLQAQEYMRMSGIERMRFVLMALTFPFEMREFVVEYDHIVAQRTADKYRTAIQMVADKEVPMCDGCPPKQFCPARNVCTNATNAQLKEWMT